MALLSVGDVAPEFELRSSDGASITLAQARGHHLVLWWYPKADTPG